VGRVAQALARYDEFAEWYEHWIGDAPPLIAAQADLLPAVAGQRVLDIACGQGRMSRYLARLGADVAAAADRQACQPAPSTPAAARRGTNQVQIRPPSTVA
jgi:2-polyprenyl-3-methyl-5-hydroxy-6-metoxy-1,4-benzoquinol methylase